MIIEGLCTTTNADGSMNIAPMGPIVDAEFSSILLRPFQSSTTFQNLAREKCGVFHVVDDVLQLARTALGEKPEHVETFSATKVSGKVLANACRWFEFEVTSINADQPRSEITTRVVHEGTLHNWSGFNRAKHAVIEATILCTRLHILPAEEIDAVWPFLASAVEKTGGPAEREAFEFVSNYLNEYRRSQQ
ncbi:MAG: DUF447 family protein [Planctomycetaceae bacterium]|nr:DUF447 family protein [Planctomycetaceae bacterium]MCB9951007.1 DUF447 family protein [Planctomycetaceae bacterium]